MTEVKKEKPVKVKSLHDRLADIQLELKAPKSQFNKFANFYYRNAEDILEAVKPLLKGLVLTINDEIVQIGDRYYVKATTTLTDGGLTYNADRPHSISCSAFAREAEVKTGMDVAQVTGASSSYARKYALNGLFLIDDTQDADSKDNKEAEVSKPATTPTTPKTPTIPQTPTTPTTPAKPPTASPSQMAWVDKILKGRGERDMITDSQLKPLTSKDASAYISGKIKSSQLFAILKVPYKEPTEDLGLKE